jgi:hypothetical protein
MAIIDPMWPTHVCASVRRLLLQHHVTIPRCVSLLPHSLWPYAPRPGHAHTSRPRNHRHGSDCCVRVDAVPVCLSTGGSALEAVKQRKLCCRRIPVSPPCEGPGPVDGHDRERVGASTGSNEHPSHSSSRWMHLAPLAPASRPELARPPHGREGFNTLRALLPSHEQRLSIDKYGSGQPPTSSGLPAPPPSPAPLPPYIITHTPPSLPSCTPLPRSTASPNLNPQR